MPICKEDDLSETGWTYSDYICDDFEANYNKYKYAFGSTTRDKKTCNNHRLVELANGKGKTSRFAQVDYRNEDNTNFFGPSYLMNNPAKVRQCHGCHIPFFNAVPKANSDIVLVRRNKKTGAEETVRKVTDGDSGKAWADLDDCCDIYRVSTKKHTYVRKWNPLLDRYDNVLKKVAEEQGWYMNLASDTNKQERDGTELQIPHLVHVCACATTEPSNCSVGYCNPCYIANTNAANQGNDESAGIGRHAGASRRRNGSLDSD